MTKFKYVICIDGTWNCPGSTDKDPVTQQETACPTNVERIWNALTGHALDKTVHYGRISDLLVQEGEAVYFDGVGSTGPDVAKWLGGGTGSGTSERIRDAYRFLAERWDEGDEIYLFGFSRGAYAARSLAGFLNHAGLPEKRCVLDEAAIAKLYEPYRDRTNGPLPNGHIPVPVTFVGVWDTVGALAFGDGFNNYHQTSPGNVERVAHALALDERRETFAPTLWGARGERTKYVREVWFPGVHSNVGGGYAEAHLSDLALFWMLQQAKAAGLSFDPAAVESVDSPAAIAAVRAAVPTAVMRDSYTEFLKSFDLVGRTLAKVKWGAAPRGIAPGQLIHEAVLERMQQAPGYTPVARLPDGSSLTPAAIAGREEIWQRLEG